MGIQIALEFISDLNGSSSVKDRTIHIFTDCQAAIISAFNSQVPNNKIEIILKGYCTVFPLFFRNFPN